MIVGIDHIQFFVPELEKSRIYLENLGYRTQFTENDFVKDRHIPYFKFQDKDLIFLKLQGSMSIEIVNSKHLENMGEQMLVPSFKGNIRGRKIKQIDSKILEFSAMNNKEVGFSECLNLLFIYTGKEKFLFNSAVLRTSSIQKTKELLIEHFNFLPNKTNQCALKFPKTPFSEELEVNLLETANKYKLSGFIDYPGCVLISFLTTNIHADVEKLLRLKLFNATKIMTFSINKKEIKVSMINGNNGELFELIQI